MPTAWVRRRGLTRPLPVGMGHDGFRSSADVCDVHRPVGLHRHEFWRRPALETGGLRFRHGRFAHRSLLNQAAADHSPAPERRAGAPSLREDAAPVFPPRPREANHDSRLYLSRSEDEGRLPAPPYRTAPARAETSSRARRVTRLARWPSYSPSGYAAFSAA